MNDCDKCPFSYYCKKGYVIDCLTGEVYEYPSLDDFDTSYVAFIKTYNGEN